LGSVNGGALAISSSSVADNAATGDIGRAAISSTSPTQDEAIRNAREFFNEFRVDESTQHQLIRAYIAGEQWDSASSSNIPITVAAYKQNGYDYTVNTYVDGSINVLRIQEAVAPGELGGISECTQIVNGSQDHRNGCKVDFWYGLVSMSFKANFTYVTPGYDRIDMIYGANNTVGGACDVNTTYFGIVQSTENSNGPARARYEVQAQMCGVPYSTTFFLELTVGAGGANFNFG
jgi:hypothetical protein